MAASFDDRLPFPELEWDSFQKFCVSLLRCLYPEAVINQYGGKGHRQRGTDIIMERSDGEIWSFQAKRESKFGKVKARKVIEEHKADAQKKFILLSKVASGDERDELSTHTDWELWDQEDLSERFRCLDPWDQHRLIDIYFPGKHFALTGKVPSPTWLSPEEFFSHLLSDESLFHHCWEVVGRKSEKEQLRVALSDKTVRVIGLIGKPGEGKTRLLLDGLDQTKRIQPETRIVIASGQGIDATDLAALGRRDTLLVVEDAHLLESLDPLCRHLLQKPNARLLLACHPAKAPAIETNLARFNLHGAAYQAITLEPPSQDDAEALARQVLARHGGDQRLAPSIASRCQDSPLAVVIGAQLVALEGLDPRKFQSSQAFQDRVWSRYIRMVTTSVGEGAGAGLDVDRVRRILLLFALLQPLNPESAGSLNPASPPRARLIPTRSSSFFAPITATKATCSSTSHAWSGGCGTKWRFPSRGCRTSGA